MAGRYNKQQEHSGKKAGFWFHVNKVTILFGDWLLAVAFGKKLLHRLVVVLVFQFFAKASFNSGRVFLHPLLLFNPIAL